MDIGCAVGECPLPQEQRTSDRVPTPATRTWAPLALLFSCSVLQNSRLNTEGRTMSASNTIDFWFTVGSTYTYLTVSRLHNLEAAAGVRFQWRPFNARAIMQE